MKASSEKISFNSLNEITFNGLYSDSAYINNDLRKKLIAASIEKQLNYFDDESLKIFKEALNVVKNIIKERDHLAEENIKLKKKIKELEESH